MTEMRRQLRDQLQVVTPPAEPAEPSTVVEAAEPAEAADEEPKPAGVLYDQRDVARMQLTCSTLNKTLVERFNIHIDPHAVSLDGLRGQAEARALCKLLVKKGIVTDDEINYEVLSFCADVLAVVLQQAETDLLTAKHRATGVQPVHRPLIVAKH